MAALDLACELFKQDNGQYPTSTEFRCSITYFHEAVNSSLLYQQVSNYMDPATVRVGNARFDSCGGPSVTNLTILDPWETPYNYYCTYPPIASVTLSNVVCWGIWGGNLISIGGKKNQTKFDLFSYGPDRKTYVAGITYNFSDPKLAEDDLKNFK
jgi:hypothetical protein